MSEHVYLRLQRYSSHMLKNLKGRKIDYVLRNIVNNKFFSKGWGCPEVLQQCMDFLNMPHDERKFVREVYGVLEKTSRHLKISKGKSIAKDDAVLFTGEFQSPLNYFVPGALPKECEKVRFEMILPNYKKHGGWKCADKPICMHFPHTGDHGFQWRRYMTALPLAKEHGIGSIILQNPFYGCRKPRNQTASAVNHVSDIFVMGVGLLMETVILMLWCKRKELGPLGISGVSMGGHMATVAQTGWFEPLSVVPCLSWTSAAPCYTKGVLSHAVDWQTLESQLDEDPRYQNLLRSDPEYMKKFDSHYAHPEETEIERLMNRIDAEDEMYEKETSSFATLVSDKSSALFVPLYERGRKIGSVIVEADLYKHIASVSSSAVNSINVPSLVSKRTNETFTPSLDTRHFMCRLFDQSTHLSHLRQPCEGSSVVFVSALHDGYFPREYYSLQPQHVWNNVRVTEVDSGHALGIALHQRAFNDAIVHSFRTMGCQV